MVMTKRPWSKPLRSAALPGSASLTRLPSLVIMDLRKPAFSSAWGWLAAGQAPSLRQLYTPGFYSAV